MMSLSSIWKTLSTKIKSKTMTGKNQTLRPNVVHTSGKCIPHPVHQNVFTPLEYALWSTPSSGTIKITKKSSCTVSDYPNPKKSSIGRYVAMDCEFVGVGPEDRSALARVSIVNYYGVVILDAYVKPKERVTNWRTWVSGITPQHMKEAITFEEAQELASDIINNKIIVGHAVHYDLESLNLSISRSKIRDTAKLPGFRKISKGKSPSLKRLCEHYLSLDIQNKSHSSVEDAQAVMALFRLYRKLFGGVQV